MTRVLSVRFVGLALAVPFLVGVIAFTLAGLLAGVGAETFSALAEQASQQKLNPLLAGVLGLAPVLLLFLVLAVGGRFAPRVGWGPAAAWGGLVPIAVLELWAHWEVWTTYFPSRSMPGFPHGLELVIVPIFFAPVGMLAGVAVGLWLGRPTGGPPPPGEVAPEADA